MLIGLCKNIWLFTFWVLQVEMGKAVKRIYQESSFYKYMKNNKR